MVQVLLGIAFSVGLRMAMVNTSTVASKLQLMCIAAAVQPVQVQLHILANYQELYVISYFTKLIQHFIVCFFQIHIIANVQEKFF